MKEQRPIQAHRDYLHVEYQGPRLVVEEKRPPKGLFGKGAE